MLKIFKIAGPEIAMPVRGMSTLSFVLGLAVVVSGCVLSVEPVISESAATFEPRLLGMWEEVSGSDRAVVSRAAEKTYAIEYTSDGKVGRFEARLGQLGNRLVLDVWPAPSDNNLPQPYANLLIAGHLLFSLDVSQDEIHLTAFEQESLLAALRAGRVEATHRRTEDQLILRGTTEELRSVLGPFLARPGALTKVGAWRRPQSEKATAALRSIEVPCFEALPWPGADQIFHRDPHWLGADGASSVDLGGGRTLWLFGDTWIDPAGKGTRQGARMVSNSLGIQIGTDPTTASISFYWGRGADGSPAPFFPDRGAESLWLGNGIHVGDRLVLFMARTLRNTGTGLGFEHVGWTAVMVENSDAAPPSWRVRQLDTPTNPLGILVGYAAVLQLGEHVYAFGSQNPVKSHPIYAARWPAEQVRRANLRHPEWWAGDRLGWVPDSSHAPRWPLFENGQSDLSIHIDPVSHRFLEVQTQGFGPADVVLRSAPALGGPWPEPRTVYRPPEYFRPNVMIYSAKAHPQLTGADLVLTYSTNTFQFAEHLTDGAIYYPHFVRLTRCK
jgi:hypothetical protein